MGEELLSGLSSRSGTTTQVGNREVAARCLAEPALIPLVVAGLGVKDPAEIGDCAEVLTKIAEERPELVAPHVSELAAGLSHKTTRVRWESTHALALAAAVAPAAIAPLLPQVVHLVRTDTSVIVRDYAVDAIAGYADVDADTACVALPILRKALAAWDGRHAARALDGLTRVVPVLPEFAPEAVTIGQAHLEDRRAVVRRAAHALVRRAAR